MNRNAGVMGIVTSTGTFHAIPNLPYVYMHKEGCQGPAFVTGYLPMIGEHMTSKGMVNLDGSQIRGLDELACGTCQASLRPAILTVDNFQPTVGGA